MQEKVNQSQQMTDKEDNSIQITYYSDPLCCWSWAFEPQWRKLRFDFRGKIKWRYRMGGMLSGWDSFDDPMNSVSRPLQMGPVWLEAKHISGMPMEDKIWYNDPPASSYPACAAVKCAGLQSPEAEEWYLRRTREAIMIHGKNIARQEVLLEVAETLAAHKPQLFNSGQFRKDLGGGAGNEAFRQDLQEVRYHGIGRYPTLTIQKPGAAGVIITGYRPYEVLLEAVKQVEPELQPTQQDPDPEAFQAYWGALTERELKEAEGVPQ